MALSGWHPGERSIRARLALDADHTTRFLYTSVDGELPPEHIQFHTTRLPFLPVTTLDADGRPWGSILAGREGQLGFIEYPTYSTLRIHAHLWPGDPLLCNSKGYSTNNQMLIAGIGIEFSTRRRNKLAGHVKSLEVHEQDIDLDVFVNQAIGNCPKYINVRLLDSCVSTNPKIICENLHLTETDRLPEQLVAFITRADTLFIGTSYNAKQEDARSFPSHLGMNQRGGHKGFIRVLPSDNRNVILPDYSGNRIMTSLGNIEATPLASFTLVDFQTGQVLYLTGQATNHVGEDARRIMPMQNALTWLKVTGYVFVDDALPVRQKQDTPAVPSPYSPPIKYLAEESEGTTSFVPQGEKVQALLTKISIHSPTIATFTWSADRELKVTPGQAIILDLSPFIGKVSYQHMAPYNPSSVNDDRIRTWTVSSGNQCSQVFDLTIKLKQGGAATTALFAIAHKLSQLKPDLLKDTKELGLRVDIVGVTGEFVLPSNSNKLLWIAGGIGLTPFLSMLKAIKGPQHWHIIFLLSAREPEVLLPLIESALQDFTGSLLLDLHVFSNAVCPDIVGSSGDIRITRMYHARRLESSFLSQIEKPVIDEVTAGDRKVYLCGPQEFERTVVEGLSVHGVKEGFITREGFAY